MLKLFVDRDMVLSMRDLLVSNYLTMEELLDYEQLCILAGKIGMLEISLTQDNPIALEHEFVLEVIELLVAYHNSDVMISICERDYLQVMIGFLTIELSRA